MQERQAVPSAEDDDDDFVSCTSCLVRVPLNVEVKKL